MNKMFHQTRSKTASADWVTALLRKAASITDTKCFSINWATCRDWVCWPVRGLRLYTCQQVHWIIALWICVRDCWSQQAICEIWNAISTKPTCCQIQYLIVNGKGSQSVSVPGTVFLLAHQFHIYRHYPQYLWTKINPYYVQAEYRIKHNYWPINARRMVVCRDTTFPLAPPHFRACTNTSFI